MKDVLLAATQESGAMIEENLNGISFANSRMALNNLVLTLQQKRDYLESIKMEVTKVDEQRRQDVWQLLQREVSGLVHGGCLGIIGMETPLKTLYGRHVCGV